MQQAMQPGAPYAAPYPPPQQYAPAPGQIPPIPPQPPALPPGTLVGGRRYQIQGYIGGGGFAHIYVAWDMVLGHQRAIKEAFYRDASTQQQFRLEAEFILNARHPNLVRGYTVFEEAGRFFLVMDYVDGYTVEEQTISQIRATGHPIAEAEVLDWITPICDAIAVLHAQPKPIIHRDVKPANIKVTRQGVPVLIDLGLAKLYVQGTQTVGAALAFTPGYAPPEQYQAAGTTDQRTDVYGLGATLYYLLTGYQPTEAPARLSATALPGLIQLNPRLGKRTEAAVLKAMALDPRERQQSIRELQANLREARAALTAPHLVSAAPASVASADGVAEAEQATPVAPTAVGDAPAPVAAGEPAPGAPLRQLACSRCGAANATSARFCKRCGAPLRAPAEGGAQRAAAWGVVPPPDVPLAPIPRFPAPTPAPNDGWSGLSMSISRALHFGRIVDPAEGRVLIAGMLSLVAFSLSLLAIFSGWLIAFVLPGLAFAGWAIWRLARKMPREFHRLAWIALALNACWPAVWLLALHFATQATRG